MATLLHGSSPSRPSTIVSTSTPLHADETPTDLLLATPPQILKLLTLAAPIIQSLTTFVQLLTWTHPSFFSSLLVLLGWWTLCLFGRYIFLYGLNALVLVYVISTYLTSASSGHAPTHHRHRARPATLTPASYMVLLSSSQILAEHVHTLRTTIVHPLAAHLSFTPVQAGKRAPAYSTAWLAITSYPCYLLVTYLVPTRFIFLAIGSAAILWNAPFFRTLRQALWKSAAVRWVCRILLGIASGGSGLRKEWGRTKSGVGIPGLLGRRKGGQEIDEKPVKVAAEEAEGDDVQLTFTVFENQRWWVGLDWTHALLPGERASWTDPSLNPSSPPASFTLPPPSTTYTPSPTRADPTSRLKRTTEWKWLDPEWKVMRSTYAPPFPAAQPSSPPSSPLPTSSSSGSIVALALSRGDPRPTIPSSPSSASISLANSLNAVAAAAPSLVPNLATATTNATPSTMLTTSSGAATAVLAGVEAEDAQFAHWVVDDEGWQYGDNQFMKMGPKGGLGKYTRRRAWVRRAGLVERCERVAGEEKKDKDKDAGGKSKTKERGKDKEAGGAGGGASASLEVGGRGASLRERRTSSGEKDGERERDRDRDRRRDSAGPAGDALRRRTSTTSKNAVGSPEG